MGDSTTQITIKANGWYLISSRKKRTFKDLISSLVKNPDATYTIYDYAYYLPLSWPADKQFTNDDWSIVNPNNSDEMITPNLGYWILIQNFNANANTNQTPNI